MSTATVMTQEERNRISAALGDALMKGDYETADALALKLPIPKSLAPWVRKYFTEEQIVEMELIMPDTER